MSNYSLIEPNFFEINDWSHQLINDDNSFILVPPRLQEFAAESAFEIEAKSIGLFSSGSTGEPRLISIPKEKLQKNALWSIDAFNLKSSTQVLILASPWHVAGLTWYLSAKQIGSAVTLKAPFVDQVDSFIETIYSESPHILFTVPSVLRKLHETGKSWNVPHIVVGGDRLQVDDYAWLSEHTSQITQAYGQTEAGGLISCFSQATDKNLQTEFSNCVGKAVGTIEIDCEGSFENPETIFIQSDSAFTDELYDSGDLGYFDNHNNLFITGRKNPQPGNCNSLTGLTMVLHK